MLFLYQKVCHIGAGQALDSYYTWYIFFGTHCSAIFDVIHDMKSSMTEVSFKRKRWSLGLLMLTIVVVSWVLSSFLINEIFENDYYRKPFFITYLNTAIFIFYLMPYLKKIVLNYFRTGELHYKEIEEEFTETLSDDDEIALNPESSFYTNLSLSETIRLSAQFCILWYLANLATNASLSYTSVASQTILSTTSSFFTLIIGSLAGIEKFTKTKIIALVISFVGVVLITKTDSEIKQDVHRTNWSIFLGNSLALIGALLYGVYTTLLKYAIKDEARINMKVFFGFVGLFNLIFLWPSLLVFDYFGIEKFELPSGWFVISIIGVNCLITFVSDFCWVKALLLTSPLTVTVGLSTTIPFAIIGDLIFKKTRLSIVYVAAAVMICLSFFVINRDEKNDEHVE